MIKKETFARHLLLLCVALQRACYKPRLAVSSGAKTHYKDFR